MKRFIPSVIRHVAATGVATFMLVVAGCGGDDNGGAAPVAAAPVAVFHEAWATSAQSAIEVIPGFPAPAATSLTDTTIRQVLRTSIAGTQVRVRFTNVLGTVPLVITAAHIAVSAGGSSIDPTTDTALTFAGAATATIAPGQELSTDAATLTVRAQTDLSVTMYIANTTPVVTQHTLAREDNFLVPGNQVSTQSLATTNTKQIYYFLTGVEVANTVKTNVVVAFGDSITDGVAASVNQDHRWPDYFARRIQMTPGAGVVSVVNAGISGNRVLNDATGPKAVDRFARDVFNQTGVTHVTILIGINDFGFAGFIPSQAPTVAQVTAGVQSLIDSAHARGLKVFVSTLTPFRGVGAPYYSDAADANRAAYNAFVRSNTTIDGLIDFDLATRDPSDPRQLLPAYDSGDHLHPNDLGYQAMANSINLAPFMVTP